MSAAPPKMTAVDGGVEDGIAWAIVEAPLYGAMNGYVQIPKSHPWHGLDYDDIDVEVHGGLTFSRDGWIGFDTLHSGDIWPGTPRYGDEGRFPSSRWWTAEQVAKEARALARKVAAVIR